MTRARQVFDAYEKDEDGNVIASYGTNHPSGKTGPVAFPGQRVG